VKIVHWPHPALKVPCAPVKWVDKDLRLTVGRMFDAMYSARGLGLAANQVALPIRLLVINMTGSADQPERERVYLNPEIVDRQGSVEGEEGCLSFPGVWVKIRRAKSVRIKALDLDGKPVELTASDLEARAWQHELDHLSGVVFSERFPPIAKITKVGDIRAFESTFKRMQSRGELPDTEKLRADLLALKERFESQPASDDSTPIPG
jgi:peptide deformylase